MRTSDLGAKRGEPFSTRFGMLERIQAGGAVLDPIRRRKLELIQIQGGGSRARLDAP